MEAIFENATPNLSRLRPITGIKVEITGQPAASGCETEGGEGKASCGTSDGPDDMSPEVW